MDFGFWIAIIFGCAKFVCVWKTSHQSWSQPFGHEATLALCTTYDVAAWWERRHLTAALIWFELRIGQFSTLCFAINGNMMASFFCRVLKMPMMVVRCGILLVGKFRDYGWQKHTQYFSRIFWPRISLRFLIHLWSEHVRPQNKDFTMASQSPKSSSPICWFVALTCPCNTCRYKMIYIHITSEQIILYI